LFGPCDGCLAFVYFTFLLDLNIWMNECARVVCV
jgi:hypothetical protein